MANTHKPTIATSSHKTSKPDFDVQNVSNGVLPRRGARALWEYNDRNKKKESYFPIRGCEITIQDLCESYFAFSLQGIFPDPWCGPLGPLTPTLGQKRAREQLAGDIFRYGSKYGPPTVDSTEVAKMKRNP